MMPPRPPEGKGVRKRDRGGQEGGSSVVLARREGLLRRGGGSSFGNSGSAVTIITMVGHAVGTNGPVVGEKSGGHVQACPLPLTLARFIEIACCEIFQCQGRG